MASNSSYQRRTLTTDEVINAVFADDDSADEFLESSSESEVEETSSDEETNTSRQDKHRCYKWKSTSKE